MRSFYKFLIIIVSQLCFISTIQSQTINIVRFNTTSNYVVGSGVSVVVNPTGIFALNNQFILELSNPGGTFPASPKILTTVNEFYVPVINGTLPAGLAVGTYKLRVRATTGLGTTPETYPVVETLSFNIIAGTSDVPSATSELPNNSSFFNCSLSCLKTTNTFGSLTQSFGATSTILPKKKITICNYSNTDNYKITLIDLINGTQSPISYNNGNGDIIIPDNLTIGTYVFEIEKNNNSVYSLVFLFHGNGTSLGNSTSEVVCVGVNVSFTVDITNQGIGRNYNGSKYMIDFGDNSTVLELTQAQMISNPTITHNYSTVSCAKTDSNFIIKETLLNKGVYNGGANTNYCTEFYKNGNGVEKKVNVSLAPKADFTLANKQCINLDINAINKTILGSYGNSGNCLDKAIFTWYYKKPGELIFTEVTISSWIDSMNNLTIPKSVITIPGCWNIKLAAVNEDLCQTLSEVSKTIKIEIPPTASFTNSPQSPICPNTQIQFTNTSNVTSLACQEPTYLWTVSPSTGYQFVNPTNSASKDPLILFITPGIYSVTLSVTNSCGTVTTSKNIEVSGSPMVSFSPSSLSICTSSPPSHTIDFSQAGSQPIYSPPPFAPNNYIWTVTGAGVTASDYSYIGGTTSSSQYPKITFTSYKTYAITVVVNGNCPGSGQATFTLTLTSPPTVSSQPLVNQTLCQNSTSATALIVSATGGIGILSYQWYRNSLNNTTSGISITGATSDNFTPPTTTVGTLYYYCVISQPGSGCNAISNIATVNIIAAPAITSQPASSTVCQGGTPTVLSFAVSGATGTPSYQWYSNVANNTTSGIAIPGAITATYAPPSTTAGTLYYYCVILLPSGGCSNIQTTAATVVIAPLLTISTQPITTQNLCVGGTIPSPLSVTATGGTGTLSYQWYSNTTNSTIGATQVGTNLPAYTPPTFNTAGTFYYYVIVSATGSGCGTATSSFSEVVVLADPSISVQPLVTQTQCQNSAATPLTLTAIDGVGTFSYQWYKTSTPINTGGILVGINAPSYTPLTDVVGTFYYYCLVSQTGLGCSVKSNTATVVVVTAPQITTHPQSAAVCEGTPIPPLTVAFSNGAGTASYQWYDNIGLISGATANTYTPTNTVTTSYYCIITFSSGGCSSITSNTAIITINPQPTIPIQPLATQTICVGGTISSPLAVTPLGGTGSPSYQWYTTTNNSATGGSPVGTNLPTYTPPVLTIAQTYNYYVIITYIAGGCSSVTSNLAQIVVVNDPTVTTQPLPSQTVCQTAPSSSLAVSVSGGISAAYSYQWYSNISNNNTSGTPISGALTDTYTPPTALVGTTYYYCVITQTSGSGCNVSSATAAVVVTLAPTFTSQPLSSTICLGGTPTVLSVAYANGVGTPTYQWFSNTTNSTSGATAISGENNATFSPPNSPVGTMYYYCVISLPPTGGCSSITSDIAFVTINAGATIDSQPTVTQSLCLGASLSTPLSITYSGGTGTATYQWYSNSSSANSGGTLIPAATNASYTPSVFTTTGVFYYYAVVTLSGNGCGPITSNVAEIVIVADPVVSSQPLASQTICQNVVPTSLSVAVSGGISALYSYQWFSNASNNNASGTPISGALTDTYTPPTSTVGTLYYYCVVTQTSGSGCAVSSTTAAIVVNLAPTFTSQPVSSIICMGQTPTLLSVSFMNGVGTPTYQWYSNGINTISGSSPIAGATNTTYAPPNSTAGTVYYYCIITLPATGGCSNLTSTIASVTVNQNPIISNKNSLICSDNPFLITPNTSGGDIVPMGTTYTWTNPSISPAGSITGASAQSTPQTDISQNLINTTTSPATVTYIVTPLSGVCTGVNFTIVVTVNPAISPNVISTNSLCFGANNGAIQTNIRGGIPFSSGAAYQISWTGPNGFTSAASNISNLAPGDYTLSVADAGGCPIANTYTITEPNDIVITTDLEKDVSCFNDANGEIKITVSGGTLNYNIAWTKNGTAFANTKDLSNLSPGIYAVTVSDANNCGPKTASFTITEPPILAVNLVNKTDILCFGAATGTLTVNIVGGTSPYTYAWSGPNGFSSSNQNLTSLFAGTYNLVVTDNSGCAKNLSVQLTQTPEIKITATTTPIICYGANDASISIAISGGVAPYALLWSNLGSGTYQDNLSAGDYLITVTDALNCIQTLNVNIPEAPIFTINPVVKNISCFGDKNGSINLNILGGIAPVKLVWDDSAVAGTVRNNLGPGSYTVTITDGKPCTIKRTFIILEPQLLVLQGNTTNALDCDNANSGAINLLVSGGSAPFTYSWSNGATSEDLSNIPAGNYLVSVKDANGCSQQAQYSINRPPPIVSSVATKTDFNCDTKTVKQTFVAQVSGGVPPYQLVWSSGAVSGPNNEFMNTSQNGTVILNATDAIGCQSSYTFTVDIPTLGSPSYNSSSYAYSTYGTFSINDPIQFTNTATGDYISMIWDFGDGSVSTDLNPVHSFINPKEYVVTQTVTYPFGCVYVQKITFTVGKGYVLVVPTAFTPNNDSLNDTFRPVTKGLKKVRLDIYDTWGSMIYSESGDIIKGWDGKIKGNNAENGNYYCKVSGETFYGIIINENTPFVLLK
jgi:gliding motility-associated-like protein